MQPATPADQPATPGLPRLVALLMELSWRLAVRPPVRTRSGVRPRGALLVRLGLVVVVAGVILAATIPLDRLFSSVVSGAVGRLIVIPVFSLLSTSAVFLHILFAVPVLLGAFLLTNDMEALLLTPTRPVWIIAAKMLSLWAGLAVVPLVVGLPVLLAIGQTLQEGLAYDLATLLILVLLPAAPLGVALLVMLAAVRWMPPSYVRTMTAVGGALLSIAIFVAVQVTSQAQTHSGQSVAALRASLTQVTGDWWTVLPTAWPGQALAAAALGDTTHFLVYLAATVGLTAVLLGGGCLLAGHLFGSGWATYREVGRRTKATSVLPAASAPSTATLARGQAAQAAVLGAWWLLAKKEWVIMQRDALVWSRLLYPIVILGFLLFQGSNKLERVLHFNSSMPILVAGFGPTFAVLVLSTVLALPILNREREMRFALALAPISLRTVLLSKWVACAVPIGAVSLLAFLIGAHIQHLSILAGVVGSGLTISMAVGQTGLSITFSAIWPAFQSARQGQPMSVPARFVSSLETLAVVVAAAALVITWGISALTLGIIEGVLLLCVIATLVIAPRRLSALLAEGTS